MFHIISSITISQKSTSLQNELLLINFDNGEVIIYQK